MSEAGDAACAAAVELCAIAAPTFAEGERGDEVARRLASLGLDVSRDAVGNVVARLGGDGPATIFAAHLDTVFPADTVLEPRRDGGVLRGPGIGDNCLGLAALLHVARLLSGDGRRYPAPEVSAPVVLAATVGEEGLGDLRGAKALLDEVACSAFVAIEGHGIDDLNAEALGSVRYRATYRGPGGHSWADRGTPSALHELFASVQDALKLAGPVAANVGVVRGGTSVNTIAPEAMLEIDLRSEDAAELRAAARRVHEALARTRAPEVRAEVEVVGDRPAGATPEGHPLLRAARQARADAGLPPAKESASSTDANAALGRGIPGVTLGVSRGGNVHRADEWIEVEPVADGLRALEHLALAACAGL